MDEAARGTSSAHDIPNAIQAGAPKSEDQQTRSAEKPRSVDIGATTQSSISNATVYSVPFDTDIVKAIGWSVAAIIAGFVYFVLVELVIDAGSLIFGVHFASPDEALGFKIVLLLVAILLGFRSMWSRIVGQAPQRLRAQRTAKPADSSSEPDEAQASATVDVGACDHEWQRHAMLGEKDQCQRCAATRWRL